MMIRCWLALVALALAGGVVLAGRDALTAKAVSVVGAAPVPADIAAAGAPAMSVTGTTALPALPAPTIVAAAIAHNGIGVADPFSMRAATRVDRGRALDCLASVIYYEASSETTEGQEAVAQVVLNRVRHPAFPATVCGVVYQGSEQAGCQFSFACDGAMRRRGDAAAWSRAVRVAALALSGSVYAPVGLATHYHTYAVTPVWNRGLVMTAAVGAHFFHRWKGYWGTQAAFTQPYRGGEPAPHFRAETPLPTQLPLPTQTPSMVIAAVAPLPVARQGPITDAAPALPDNLPPASVVLDRWKDSGKPLR